MRVRSCCTLSIWMSMSRLRVHLMDADPYFVTFDRNETQVTEPRNKTAFPDRRNVTQTHVSDDRNWARAFAAIEWPCERHIQVILQGLGRCLGLLLQCKEYVIGLCRCLACQNAWLSANCVSYRRELNKTESGGTDVQTNVYIRCTYVYNRRT